MSLKVNTVHVQSAATKSDVQPSDNHSTQNFGWGIGNLAQSAFNYLANSWQQLWNLSHEKHALGKQIYRPIQIEQHNKRSLQELEPAAFDLRTLDGTNGFAVYGPSAFGYLGASVRSAGDFNGDGKDDLVIGANGANFNGVPIGAAYVLFGQQTGWPAVLNLTSLNGSNGFVVYGLNTTTLNQLGSSVSKGDFNADGKDDLVLGAPGASFNGVTLGAAYVIFGKQTVWPALFNLTTLNGTNGFAVYGLNRVDNFGCSVNTAGDINGDGKEDLVLGATGADLSGSSNVGAAYIIFGQQTVWPALLNLTTLNGTNGFAVYGLNPNDNLGSSVSTAGDINGDGRDDLLLGASNANATGLSSAGAAYVLFGKSAGWPALFDLTTLNGTNGFAVYGLSQGDQLGVSVSALGDLNGDGKDDLVLGASGVNANGFNYAGAAYVLFGQSTGWPALFNLSTLNGTNGFVIYGLNSLDTLGSSVNLAGDLNGDGTDDLVIGANLKLNYRGATYVIFGQSMGWPAQFNLTTLNGTNGFAVYGLNEGDQLGDSATTAGDLNNDGKSDLVIGASYASANGLNNLGATYIIFGKNSSFLSPVFPPSPYAPVPLSSSSMSSVAVPTPHPTPFTTPSSPSGIFVPTSFPSATGSPPVISSTPSILEPSSTKPNPPDTLAIGIGVGVTGALLLGGLVAVIVVIKRKQKNSSVKTRNRSDSVQVVTLKAYS